MSQIVNFQRAALNFSTIGDNTVLAAGGTIKVWKILFTTSGAVNVTFKSGATVIGGPYIFTANGSSMTMYYDGDPHFLVSTGNAFIVNLSAGVTITGQIHYTRGG